MNILNNFRPIDLSEMSTIRLMNRIDTKYMTNRHFIPDLLEKAIANYRVQVIENKPISLYRTLYYDTADVEMYIAHHNRKLQRQKVRTRTYMSSSSKLSFLEIKNKTNQGRTKKKRIEISPDDFFDFKTNQNAVDFLHSHSTYNTSVLQPQVANSFERITLVNDAKTERLTIDYNFYFENKTTGKNIAVPDLAIIELKQDGLCHSLFKDFLLEARISPVSISKYCLGTILTNENVKSNRFKRKLFFIDKIIKIM